MPDSRWVVTEHKGAAGLAELTADWRRLFDAMPDPALWHSHEAHAVYLEHLCPAPEEFCCYALSDGERVRAILPIERRPESGSPGGGTGFPVEMWGMPLRDGWAIADAIGPEDDARRALVPEVIAHMRRQPGRPAVLGLGLTREATVMWEGMRDLSRLTRFEVTDRGEFVIPTDMTVEAFVARLSSKTRNTIRRAGDKFEAMEGARYERSVESEDVLAAYEDFLQVEASGWKGERGTSIRQTPELAAFYRGLLERLGSDGRCEIHSLHADGRCIAAGLCVFTRRTCVVLKSGYDESYSLVSPGKLLAQATLLWCCGDPAVDSVSEVTDAPWLRAWHPATNRILRAYVSLRPITGALALLALRAWYGPVRDLVRARRSWQRSRLDSTQTQRGRDAV